MSWFTTLDGAFNSLCVLLMFDFVHVVDRVRFAGVCCCLCKQFWNGSSRQEYDNYVMMINRQQSKDVHGSKENQRQQNKNAPNGHKDLEAGKGGKNNGTRPGGGTTRDQADKSPQIRLVPTSSQGDGGATATTNTSDKESNKVDLEDRGNNNNNNKGGQEEEEEEQQHNHRKSINYTTTSQLDLKSNENESRMNNPDWTIASDVNSMEKETEFESNLVEGESTKMQNQYAMEIMKLHANIDQF